MSAYDAAVRRLEVAAGRAVSHHWCANCADANCADLPEALAALERARGERDEEEPTIPPMPTRTILGRYGKTYQRPEVVAEPEPPTWTPDDAALVEEAARLLSQADWSEHEDKIADGLRALAARMRQT